MIKYCKKRQSTLFAFLVPGRITNKTQESGETWHNRCFVIDGALAFGLLLSSKEG